MFTRRVFRTAIPMACILFRATLARSSNWLVQHFPSLDIGTSTYGPNIVSRRLFAQESKPGALTADYQYVRKAISNDNILLIDVREPDEVKEHGKIPNSINIPLGNVSSVLSAMSEKEFQQTYDKPKPTTNTEIVFYCMIGKRSGKAQQNAIDLGYKNTKNYLGSWTDWSNKGQ